MDGIRYKRASRPEGRQGATATDTDEISRPPDVVCVFVVLASHPLRFGLCMDTVRGSLVRAHDQQISREDQVRGGQREWIHPDERRAGPRPRTRTPCSIEVERHTVFLLYMHLRCNAYKIPCVQTRVVQSRGGAGTLAITTYPCLQWRATVCFACQRQLSSYAPSWIVPDVSRLRLHCGYFPGYLDTIAGLSAFPSYYCPFVCSNLPDNDLTCLYQRQVRSEHRLEDNPLPCRPGMPYGFLNIVQLCIQEQGWHSSRDQLMSCEPSKSHGASVVPLCTD